MDLGLYRLGAADLSVLQLLMALGGSAYGPWDLHLLLVQAVVSWRHSLFCNYNEALPSSP